MTVKAPSEPLRGWLGLVATGWLGFLACAVIVYGMGGWESWPHERPVAVCHSATEDARILDCEYHGGTWYSATVHPAHGLPRGPALVIGCLGAVFVLWVWRRSKRR